jgi:hypothetical protein
MSGIQKILHPTDFSANARSAFEGIAAVSLLLTILIPGH